MTGFQGAAWTLVIVGALLVLHDMSRTLRGILRERRRGRHDL